MIADLKPYPAYKDPGVPWLAKVPEHWDVRRLKYVLREHDVRSDAGAEQLLRVSQYTGVTERKRDDGLDEPDTRAASLVGYKRAEPGDLVVNIMLAWNGSMGVSAFAGIASPAYCVYRFGSCAEPWYFHHLLRSPVYKARIKAVSTGVVESRLRLYTDDLCRLEALLPPLAEQAAIVRFLDHADRRIRRYIRAKQKLIKLLEEQKQAIIHRAVTRGLDPNVRLKPSGVEWLGDVPEHWEVKKLHQVTDPKRQIMYGIVLPGPNVDEGVFIVKGGNCEPGRLRKELLSKTTREIESAYGRSRLRCHDIVFAIRGGVGAAELVPLEFEGANLTQDAARIAAGRGIEPRWLGYAVRAPIFQEHIKSRVVGATVRGINIRDLKRVEIVVAPLEEQLAIVRFLDNATLSLNQAIDRSECEVSLLDEYRTRLIADLVTGKLDVRAAADALPEEVEEAIPCDDGDMATDEVEGEGGVGDGLTDEENASSP